MLVLLEDCSGRVGCANEVQIVDDVVVRSRRTGRWKRRGGRGQDFDLSGSITFLLLNTQIWVQWAYSVDGWSSIHTFNCLFNLGFLSVNLRILMRSRVIENSGALQL